MNDANVLDDAKEHYMFGRFEHTIYLLSECVKNPDIEPAIELEAYQYIGKAYVALQQEQDAINSIRVLLSLVPDYEPDPENDKQEYIDLVHQVKRESAPKQMSLEESDSDSDDNISKTVIGAGVAIATFVLLLILGPSGNN